jgi:hypothetical protein
LLRLLVPVWIVRRPSADLPCLLPQKPKCETSRSLHAISEMLKIAMLLKKDEVEIRVKTYDALRRKKSWANKMHVD